MFFLYWHKHHVLLCLHVIKRGAPIRYVRISIARTQYRFDHFYLTRPLSASSHVFHLFSSNLSRSDGLAPSRNALPPLFTLLSFGSGFRVQGSRFRWRLRRLFLEDGILVSQPSPLGNAIKLSGRTFLAPHRGSSPKG